MNHLFIGLGGTGGNIIKSFRKLYFQQFGDAGATGIGIDYLWMDSSPSSFKDSQPDWDYLGTSLALKPRNQFYIAKADLRGIINNLNSYPNLNKWIGNREEWGEVLNGLSPDAAGGQKRRLGRFLLAMNIDEFLSKVSTLVKDLQNKTGSTEITFHVMCGLAGGTGSGTLIDVLAQLRKNYPYMPENPTSPRIVTYAYLPDANPPAGWNTGNYHANAYAALLELNAMSAGRWQPYDLLSGEKLNKNVLDFVFNGCYVFTDNNSKGYTVAINSGLTDIIADFMFHKVVMSRNINWDSLQRAENAENGDSAPETEHGEPARSVRFLSFGISRIEFPEERLHESLGFEYQKQALEQLRFNNWLDGHGFIDRNKPDASSEYVNSAKVQEDWKISNAHLLLEKPIIETPESNKWKAHAATWMELANHYTNLAKEVDTSKWLAELFRLLNSAYDEQYRRHGVKQFFDYADRDKQAYATQIRGVIEQNLMNDWRIGERSLTECSNVISALRRELETRLVKIADIIEKNSLVTSKFFEQFQALEQQWSDLRYFSLITNSREKDLEKGNGFLRDYFSSLTYMRAYEYQKALINEILVQLADLQSDLDASNSMILKVTDDSKNAINAREVANSSDSTKYIATLEDKELQAKVRSRLVLDKEIQTQQTSMVRQKIFELLGAGATFKRFNERRDDIKRQLLQYSFDSVKVAHDKYIEQTNQKILGVSIIDKLYDKFGQDSVQLENQAKALIKEASDFAIISNTEYNKDFVGKIPNAKDNRALNTTGILMPMPEGKEAFTAEIQNAFKNAYQGQALNFVKSSESNNAISILSITNLMPLRFFQLVKTLKEKYEQRIAHNPVRATLEIHTEGDGSQLPDLFIMDESQMRNVARPLLLLALATGVIQKQLDPTTNQDHLVQLRKDEMGFDLPSVAYGTDLVDVIDNINDAQLMQLRQDVMTKLSPNIPFSQTEIDPLLSQQLHPILAEIKQILTSRKPKQAETLSLEWNDAAREVIKLIKGEVKL